MKKHIVYFIFISVLILSSCNNKESFSSKDSKPESKGKQQMSTTKHTEKNIEEVEKKDAGILKKVDNSSQHNTLITKEVDMDNFIKAYDSNPNYLFDESSPTLSDINEKLGVECIRKTSTGNLYSVHKVKQGGLLYIIYNQAHSSEILYTRIWYYVKIDLSLDNFSSIKTGANISDVESIDPITSIYRKRSENFYETVENFVSYHYLDDAIIIYHYDLVNGNYNVAGIEVDTEFSAHVPGVERERKIDGRILNADKI